MMDGGVAVPNMPPPGFFQMPRMQMPNFPRPRFQPPVQNVPQSSASTTEPQTTAAVPDSQATTSPIVSGAGTSNTIQIGGTDLANIHFDGKRMRKAVIRKTVDYNTSVVKYLENRTWQRDHRDTRVVQPDGLYQLEMVPPSHFKQKPMNCLTTKFMRQSTNKFRCPIFCLAWTPEGRRLVTGASSGEFTLWNGLTFSFETILQAHETSVRAMVWSHNDQWMITADHAGFIKYWQSNMNNVKMYQGHKEAIRGISLCPTDTKFASCSDDGTVRVWDFMRCYEEKILRGHGADVKCVDWHPQKSLIASGSKDNQVPVKLWDPKSGQSLATLHAHKFTVMDIEWNKNGNWLLTAARDHLIKLFDIRNLKEELQIFKGHKKEATAVAWHPINEQMFASGGSDGAIMFWNAGTDKELGAMEEAHDAIIWDLAWHPLGHVLVSGSNDHSTKFWTRNRPGDAMRDKYNLNIVITGPDGEALDIDHDMPLGEAKSLLPGMGLEHGLPPPEEEPEKKNDKKSSEEELPSIPGLDWSSDAQFFKDQQKGEERPRKKTPYSRPIPRSFEQAWISNQQPGTLVKDEKDGQLKKGKIQSLLTLELPERPPPGLEYDDYDANDPDPIREPIREPGFNPRPFDLAASHREMNQGSMSKPSMPGISDPFREDTDHRPHMADGDQDYRSDQDYRQDQDLRMDSDYRSGDRDREHELDYHRIDDRPYFDNYRNEPHKRMDSESLYSQDRPSPMRSGPGKFQDSDNGPNNFYENRDRNNKSMEDSYDRDDSFNDSYDQYRHNERFRPYSNDGRRDDKMWHHGDWDGDYDHDDRMDYDKRQGDSNSGPDFNRKRGGQNRNQSDRNRGGGSGNRGQGRGGDRGFRGRGSGNRGREDRSFGSEGERWSNEGPDNDDGDFNGDEDFRAGFNDSGQRGGRGGGDRRGRGGGRGGKGGDHGNRGGNRRGGRGGNRGRGGGAGGGGRRGRGGRGGN